MSGFLAGQRMAVIWKRGAAYEVVAARGIALGPLEDHPDPICLELLQGVIASGEPLFSEPGSRNPIFDSTSFLVCGIQSVLCVPVCTRARQVDGLLYSDHLERPRLFSFTDLLRLQRTASRWRMVEPERPRTRVQAVAAPRPEPTETAAAVALPARALRAEECVSLFRSLHSFLRAGIGLLPAFGHLELSAETPVLRQVCGDVARRIGQGVALSHAFGSNGSLDSGSVRLVAVGERTGQLDRVFERLAEVHSRCLVMRRKLVTALIYPAFLLLGTLLIAVCLPAYVMKGQLEMLRSQGQQLPALSYAVLRLGQALRHPGALLALAALATLLVWGARRCLATPAGQRALLLCPGLGPALRSYAEYRCCLTMGLSLSAGMGILEAVPLAVHATGWRFFEERAANTVDQLRSGDRPVSAMRSLQLWSPSSLSCIAAAEEHGSLAKTLLWLADVLDRELQLKLQTLTAAAEPLLMLLMGLVVGTVTLATLLPSLKLIESFP